MGSVKVKEVCWRRLHSRRVEGTFFFSFWPQSNSKCCFMWQAVVSGHSPPGRHANVSGIGNVFYQIQIWTPDRLSDHAKHMISHINITYLSVAWTYKWKGNALHWWLHGRWLLMWCRTGSLGAPPSGTDLTVLTASLCFTFWKKAGVTSGVIFWFRG